MRILNVSGYIDRNERFGDEITPEKLHGMLYGIDGENGDDVTILMNSYGGDCEAATRMFDDLRAYPGHVTVRISGTAASAATVLAQAADKLEMTPGSLFMIHDPMTIAVGNVSDMKKTIGLLETVKKAIINCYKVRNQNDAAKIAEMMTATTWMDANEALKNGFIDAIAERSIAGDVVNGQESGLRAVNRADAERLVGVWIDRNRPESVPNSAESEAPESTDTVETGEQVDPVEPAEPEISENEPETIDESAGKVSAETRRRMLTLLH